MQTYNRLYAGIDISKNEVHFAVLPREGLPLERYQRYANSQVGYEAARAMLLKHLHKQSEPTQLIIACEATSYYWLPLFLQFDQDPLLADYAVELHLLNPRWVKWDKKSRSPNHKTDQIDARDIAEYVRVRNLKSAWHYDAKWLPLRFYTRLRFHLAQSLTREKNLLNLHLFLAYSTYVSRKTFSPYLSVTSRKLLADPELLAQCSTLDIDGLAEQLLELSGGRLRDPEQNAIRLQQVLTERFPIVPALLVVIQQGIQLLLGTITHFQQQIHQVETFITELTKQDYPELAWLDSIPGIGLVLSSGIAAEIGNLERFTQVPVEDPRRQRLRPRTASQVQDAVAKYAGLWWPKNASGQFEAEERHLSREGNAYLRYYILEAAEGMRRVIPSFARYYTQKHDEASKHHHKRALVLTGSKALDLCVTLLRRKECYQAEEVHA